MALRPARIVVSAFLALILIGAVKLYESRTQKPDPEPPEYTSSTAAEATYPLRSPSFDPTDEVLASSLAGGREENPPKNLILFIGDGMGIGSISAGDALIDNPSGSLAFVRTRHIGLVRTWAANDLTTDSASSATSLASGIKTNKKMVGMTPDGRPALNILAAGRERGMATGVITTSGLADATPAAFTTRIDHRDKYHLLLESIVASQTDLLIGGTWVNKDKAITNLPYLDLVADIERLAAENGLNLVSDHASLATTGLPLLGFFPPREHAPMEHGPNLEVSTRRAIELLSEDPDGFILVVESETTDEAGHSNDISSLVAGVREFDEAVAAALEIVGVREDTLILVTADHDTGSVAITEGLFDKGHAVIRWSSDGHSSQFVPLFAFGPGADRFAGVYDNTVIPRIAASLLDLRDLPHLADTQSN